jgi:hypothetical protein
VKRELKGDKKLSLCLYVKGWSSVAYASREHSNEEFRPALLIRQR